MAINKKKSIIAFLQIQNKYERDYHIEFHPPSHQIMFVLKCTTSFDGKTAVCEQWIIERFYKNSWNHFKLYSILILQGFCLIYAPRFRIKLGSHI
jgi:hypothetical protein